MKSFFLSRVLALCVVSLGMADLTAYAQDAFKVANVRQTFSNDLIKVGSDWRKDLGRRVQATLQVGQDVPSSSVFVHAYFYDKEGHLLDTFDKPNPIWTSTPKGIQEILLPPTLQRFKNTEVYFALPEELQAKKWTTVVVAFGDATRVAAMSMPVPELAKVDFPEKSKLAAAH